VIEFNRRFRIATVLLLGGLLLAGCGEASRSPSSSSDPSQPPSAAPAPPRPVPEPAEPEPAEPRASEPPQEPQQAPPQRGEPKQAEPEQDGPQQAEPGDAVELPWPVAGAADAAALQAEVDNGAQPWLLEPTEVAKSYAAATYGWTRAEAYPGPNGTSVDVRNSAGDKYTLTLAQPGRTGDGGIWVVTAEQPS
jgi:hypothetical protein